MDLFEEASLQLNIVDSLIEKDKNETLEYATQIAKWYNLGTLGSFEMALMDLFGKADSIGKERLAIAFPLNSVAWKIWYKGEY